MPDAALAASLRRIPIGEIAFVVLVDGDERRVLDFTDTANLAGATSPSDHVKSSHTGLIMGVVGVGMLTFGAVLRVAGDATTASFGVNPDENDNTFSDAFMIAGGLLIVAGLVVSTKSSERNKSPAWSAIYGRDGFVGARVTLYER